MITFLNISYLQLGNERQKKAYQVLTDNEIIEKLAPYHPIFVGTIPINIDIENSDLDIICEISDKNEFIDKLNALFGSEKDFTIHQSPKFDAIRFSFLMGEFEIEIFGQNIPTTQQNAYRHMLIEHKLLSAKGEKFRQDIIDLKNQGYKTEPAFAELLGFEGKSTRRIIEIRVLAGR
ncbi:DUF4269 domain-containing protein [Pedobacter borealis]|uniref:DUF4269 domain-containing protein n=1 Tax=Pedobacter borealis TaxID=475254 RepID=UPI0004933269|nr:DUF4269 domain-containing protein [Pedobacter borealis]